MRSNTLRVTTSAGALILGSLVLANCGKMPGGIPGAGNCPDMASAEAVANFDWAKEFKLDVEAGAKLKGGVTAAVNLKALAAQIDADLKAACGGLAKDLGAAGDFDSGEAACKAAIKAMGDVKAKMGAKASIDLQVKPPVCSASIDAMAECSGKCDASVQGGKADVKCEGGVSGQCDAKCEGSCEMSAAAKCEGKCEGKCDAKFKGTCSGKCEGKCGAKNSSGQCDGTCEGKCESGASGECGGNCEGGCEIKGSAECKGTCSGKCSVDFKELKCDGKLEPPKVSAECKASCDADVSGKLSCTPARIALKIKGSADAAAEAQFRAAIEKNLPAILKVAIGMKDRVEGVAASVQGVVEGAQAVAQAGSSGGPAMTAALTACVAAPFKGAIDAAASVKANVNVSVDVKASASASGSASGKAG